MSSTRSVSRKLAVSRPSLNTISSDRPTSDSPAIMPARTPSTSAVSARGLGRGERAVDARSIERQRAPQGHDVDRR